MRTTRWQTARGQKLWLAHWARLGLRISNWMRAYGGVPWSMLQPSNGNREEE